jgi:hypothetical protein
MNQLSKKPSFNLHSNGEGQIVSIQSEKKPEIRASKKNKLKVKLILKSRD